MNVIMILLRGNSAGWPGLWRFVSGIWLTLMALTPIGCGGGENIERTAVYGRVTFDGEPVENGTISFIPAGMNSGPAAGATIQGGEYSISAERGVLIGTNRVEIRAHRKTGKKVPAVPPAVGEIEETEEYIPEKYGSESTLQRDIQSGSSEENFELTSK